ncbi:MAG: pyruvate flavodoxin/ferredoxin oxidoreductase [Bacteroidota bacterium]|nr:pyruvate flavodoxin/ferredoxin oxidoreductase [Bacteroidota bacterium]
MSSIARHLYKIRTGNQMIAEGAMRAGCRFFAGYPITPASGIYKGMIELLQQRGDVAVSAPDEISALAYCVGASMRGFKAMTATSGPGWALMIETLQYALMTETPVVIAMVQRLGPSTGGATQGAQGDILLTEFCTSGGYTIPVLCPATPKDSYELTMLAFSWADILRSPVVVLSDKEVGMTSERVDYGALHEPPVVNRIHPDGNGNSFNGERRMYGFEYRCDVPGFISVGGETKVTVTGSAHNKSGELKKNDAETLEVLNHLEEKITSRRAALSLVELDCEDSAETLVISFGITARTMQEAVRNARRNGKKVSSLKVMSLFPVPEEKILAAAEGVSRIVIAEENLHGQYRSVINYLFTNKKVIGVNKIGAMITPSEIEYAIS